MGYPVNGAGRRLRFAASQRTLHGAHGLMGLLAPAPADAATRAALQG